MKRLRTKVIGSLMFFGRVHKEERQIAQTEDRTGGEGEEGAGGEEGREEMEERTQGDDKERSDD